MFYSIETIKEAEHYPDHLENPVNAGNQMALVINRTKVRTAFYTVYSKKVAGVYWDIETVKRIPRRKYTPEMKSFMSEKRQEAPKPPFIFKLTVVGYIMLFGVLAFCCYLVYDSLKPPLPKSEMTKNVEKPIVQGDVFFGHSEILEDTSATIRMPKVKFGWFKIIDVNGDTYTVASAVEQSSSHQPKEQMDSVNFVNEGIPSTVKELGYSTRLKSVDEKADFYFSHKQLR